MNLKYFNIEIQKIASEDGLTWHDKMVGMLHASNEKPWEMAGKSILGGSLGSLAGGVASILGGALATNFTPASLESVQKYTGLPIMAGMTIGTLLAMHNYYKK